MKLFPSTKQDWLSLLAFPFKAYILIAICFYYYWRDQSSSLIGMARYIYISDGHMFFSVGYITSSLALIVITTTQFLTKNFKGLTVNFAFAIIGFVCGWVIFPSTVK
jgi:hypothetical protein